MGYFGLGIGHSKYKPANQIWLLAEPVPSVLHGKMFTRYILRDEVTGKAHPESSGIMFVDLAKLSDEESQAGELAALFTGKSLSPQDNDVKKVATALKSSFEELINLGLTPEVAHNKILNESKEHEIMTTS